MIFSSSFNIDFLSTSQEIGWEEHLWYDLFSVEWNVKPWLSHQCSALFCACMYDSDWVEVGAAQMSIVWEDRCWRQGAHGKTERETQCIIRESLLNSNTWCCQFELWVVFNYWIWIQNHSEISFRCINLRDFFTESERVQLLIPNRIQLNR